ncbi:SRPBCC family protein [Yinghuangia seranimata]|uniref:SRPBCC family protein n=1 Tax=Yinghuangia seranimata TaxID=408067 RepID=UPI00248B58F7|nr:SRPBCC family protein [Yinghuangia seranimata]MDI2127560.1 SRPBCC family protein [Yinghuangia seranimata]
MPSRLFYRGPAVDVLHTEYAQRGRRDEKAPILADFEIEVKAPPECVWEVLADPAGWHLFDPNISDVLVDGPVAPGTRFTWRMGRAAIRSRFAVVDPEREITWTGSSSGANVVHRHLLSLTASGCTLLRTEESMAGLFATLFYNSAKLQTQLEHWLTSVKRAAES